MATVDIRIAICMFVLLTFSTALPAEDVSATSVASIASSETINSTDGSAASTEQQSSDINPDVTTVKGQDGGNTNTSLKNETFPVTNGTKTETDSPTNSTRPGKTNGTNWEGDETAVTMSTPLGENSTEYTETMSHIPVTTDSDKKKAVNTEPGGTHNGDDAWEDEAAAKAKREMMMGMVAGIIFGIVTLIVCCVMWKLCCGKLCDQGRQKIMPMDFRGSDQLPPPPPPPRSASRPPRPRSSRSDRH